MHTSVLRSELELWQSPEHSGAVEAALVGDIDRERVQRELGAEVCLGRRGSTGKDTERKWPVRHEYGRQAVPETKCVPNVTNGSNETRRPGPQIQEHEVPGDPNTAVLVRQQDRRPRGELGKAIGIQRCTHCPAQSKEHRTSPPHGAEPSRGKGPCHGAALNVKEPAGAHRFHVLRQTTSLRYFWRTSFAHRFK